MRIKQIRESQGIKQCVLAEKLNMEPSNLTRIESGYQLPKEENLQKIANVLGVEVKDLFDFSQDIKKDELIDLINIQIKKFSFDELKFIYKFIKLYRIEK